MAKKKKVIELSFVRGQGQGSNKSGGEPPHEGSVTVEDVINELQARKGKIQRLTVTVEEEGCFYVLHNTFNMTKAERGFLVLLTLHEMMSSFYTYVGHPDNPEQY